VVIEVLLNWTFEFAVQFGTAPGFFESIDVIEVLR
jgi:hypothetical protein